MRARVFIVVSLVAALSYGGCSVVRRVPPPAKTGGQDTDASTTSAASSSAATPGETNGAGTQTSSPETPPAAPAEAPSAQDASQELARQDPPTEPAARVDFVWQIKPILEENCQPCHFEGGKMYDKLPFDRPQTILNLGENLFTRLKDPDEQALIRAFLAQSERAN